MIRNMIKREHWTKRKRERERDRDREKGRKRGTDRKIVRKTP